MIGWIKGGIVKFSYRMECRTQIMIEFRERTWGKIGDI